MCKNVMSNHQYVLRTKEHPGSNVSVNETVKGSICDSLGRRHNGNSEFPADCILRISSPSL